MYNTRFEVKYNTIQNELIHKLKETEHTNEVEHKML